jgi:charged multivesicular body protein 1
MAARVDAVSNRVKTAIMTKELTKTMGGVVNGLDKVVQSMDLEKISGTMAKFEDLFQDLDVHTEVMDSTMSAATTLSTPEDQVTGLMKEVLYFYYTTSTILYSYYHFSYVHVRYSHRL